MFQPDAVRREYESGAIWRGRLWTDTSGKFRVQAALLDIQPDKVSLRTSEGKELDVEIAKLSEADQKFLRKIREQQGGGSVLAIAPKPEKFAAGEHHAPPSLAGAAQWPTDRVVASSGFRLEPDALSASLKLMAAGVPFAQGASGDYLGSVIPLGGTDAWLLVGVENPFASTHGTPMRVLWASLTKKSVKSVQSFPAGESIVDYHAPSQQLLTYALKGGQDTPFSDEPVLTVWTTQPAAKEAQGTIAWKARLGDGDRIGHAGPWARFASANVVLQRDEDHRVIAWDIAAKQANWVTPQESFFAPEPLLSYNGKYLFLPEDQSVRILNPITGAELGRVTTQYSCSSVALHPDGKTLAVLTNNRLLLVDLTGATPVADIDANTVATSLATQMEWVNDDMLAVWNSPRGFVLFSIKHQLPIWSYEFDSSVYQADSRSGRTRTIIAGHLAYAATVWGTQQGFIVGAVPLPEEKVLSALATVDRKSYILTGPGTRMRTYVEAIASPDAIRTAVAKQLADNQWVEDPNAEFALVAKLYRGSTQSVQYESMQSGQTFSVTATPYISSCEIYRGQEVVWSSGSSSGIPPILMLQQGQDVQGAVKQWEAADVDFFQRVDIPQEVLDPAKKGGLGISDVTSRGLIPRGE